MCARLNPADLIWEGVAGPGSITTVTLLRRRRVSRILHVARRRLCRHWDQPPEPPAIVIARVSDEYSGTTEIESTWPARAMSSWKPSLTRLLPPGLVVSHSTRRFAETPSGRCLAARCVVSSHISTSRHAVPKAID